MIFLDKLFELLDYLIANDRGLNNYDTEHLQELLEEAKDEWHELQEWV